jgi:hypothetical protein
MKVVIFFSKRTTPFRYGLSIGGCPKLLLSRIRRAFSRGCPSSSPAFGERVGTYFRIFTCNRIPIRSLRRPVDSDSISTAASIPVAYFDPRRIMEEAAPSPVLRFYHQSALDRIAMHVA